MIFIHSNREIASFNIAKNVKDESNKLTTSKLTAYNGYIRLLSKEYSTLAFHASINKSFVKVYS
ncbi:hypothetical protein MTR_4g104280 [Medicago truncatula]|uniref:Uncharacterized protein n=1 Tax=Medicago truncatula TaxID=3880 RepID=G7JMP3_MEDTR|nr:hypothetical protein MTR_4g104280 [Medicago truncatula]